jgi:putative methyltransferase (TIGR04325 family)
MASGFLNFVLGEEELSARDLVKQMVPPLLLRSWQYMRGARPGPFYGLAGDYPTFEAAEAVAGGYETADFSSKAAGSLRALMAAPPSIVVDERFLQVHSALSYIVQREGLSRLSVLDYGGGAGIYAKVMRQLMPAITLDWTVLESAPVAEACKSVPGAPTQFISSLDGRSFDVVIISGTLHCLRDPWPALEEAAKQSRWLILTRLPLVEGDRDRVTLEIVPLHLRPPSSIPLWLFSEKKLRHWLADRVVLEWFIAVDAGLCAQVGATPKGFLVLQTA